MNCKELLEYLWMKLMHAFQRVKKVYYGMRSEALPAQSVNVAILTISLSLSSASPAVTEEYIEPEVPQMSANQVIWKGFVNMSGLAKFVTTAYPVSGPAQNIDEVKGDQGWRVWVLLFVCSFVYLVATGYATCDGTYCTCAGLGLHGQAEELNYKSNATENNNNPHFCTLLSCAITLTPFPHRTQYHSVYLTLYSMQYMQNALTVAVVLILTLSPHRKYHTT